MGDEAAAPGAHHERLARYLGQWDVEIRLLMPGAPARSSRATATCEWVIQGTWLGQKLEGDLFGQPYEAFSLVGYDAYAESHVVASVHSADTALNSARGPVVDPEHRVRALYGTLDEYTTGELHKPYRLVIRDVDRDSYVMEVWDLGDGIEGTQVLEYEYTRR